MFGCAKTDPVWPTYSNGKGRRCRGLCQVWLLTFSTFIHNPTLWCNWMNDRSLANQISNSSFLWEELTRRKKVSQEGVDSQSRHRQGILADAHCLLQGSSWSQTWWSNQVSLEDTRESFCLFNPRLAYLCFLSWGLIPVLTEPPSLSPPRGEKGQRGHFSSEEIHCLGAHAIWSLWLSSLISI